MTTRKCRRCLGAFYGICRKCEAPRSARTCSTCGSTTSAGLEPFFCPGTRDGHPHVETRLECDCCGTSAVRPRTAFRVGSRAEPVDLTTWKQWSLSGTEMDLCPECFHRLQSIIVVSVDALFTELQGVHSNAAWKPPEQRVQYSPTRLTLDRSRRFVRVFDGRMQVAPAPEGPWRFARREESTWLAPQGCLCAARPSDLTLCTDCPLRGAPYGVTIADPNQRVTCPDCLVQWIPGNGAMHVCRLQLESNAQREEDEAELERERLRGINSP